MNPPLRVLHLIAHLGRGGTERQLALTLAHLDPAEVQSTVAYFNRSENAVWDEFLEQRDIEVIDVGATGGLLRRAFAITRLARTRKIDLLHSWSLHTNAYVAVSGRLAGARRWGSLRGSLETAGFRGLPRFFQWLCLHGVERIVTNAAALVQELERAGVPSAHTVLMENSVLLPNAVEPATSLDRAAARAELGLAPDDLVVGTIGNLRRIKNHEMLIDAMAQVVAAQPRARAVIIGQPLASEPETAHSLAQRTTNLGLDGRVQLVGFREDAAALIPAFDVVTLTSHSEGMPNVVLEAMAAGVAVVAVSVGGVPELIEPGRSGLLVPPGDAAALATALATLLGDSDLATLLGREGRARVAAHDPQALAQRLTAAYQEMGR